MHLPPQLINLSIRNGLSGRQTGRRARGIPNYIKNGLKIIGHRSHGVINTNVKFMVQINTDMYRNIRRKVLHSECLKPSAKHGDGSVMVLGCIPTRVWRSCQNWWKYECRKSTMQYHLECVWQASFFSMTVILDTLSIQWTHTWIEKHTIEHYQSWIGHSAAWTTL